MSRSGTIAKDFWYTLFGNRETEQLEQELETYDEESLEVRREGKIFKKPSLYIKVFEGEGHIKPCLGFRWFKMVDMINAIMEKETHLLSDAEWDVLKVYHALECMWYILSVLD